MSATKGQILGELDRLRELLAGYFSQGNENYKFGIALRDRINNIENMVNGL
uniref:Uncharacterized protein n=1 Tax=viral metagenome TaxID=1070528 RepID=A0A6M3LFZ6_9ZZZZ